MPFVKGKSGNPEGKQADKRTGIARIALANFIDGNTTRLQRLLDKVEFGIPKENAEFVNETVGYGDVEYVVKPDAQGALKSINDFAEYTMPKLARTELAGDKENPLTLLIADLGGSALPVAPSKADKE